MHLYYDHTEYSFPLYIFLWPEDGPQWPKHDVVSIINRIQGSCVLTYPTPTLNVFDMEYIKFRHQAQRASVIWCVCVTLFLKLGVLKGFRSNSVLIVNARNCQTKSNFYSYWSNKKLLHRSYIYIYIYKLRRYTQLPRIVKFPYSYALNICHFCVNIRHQSLPSMF